ncbi:MAG: O-antigen ligase family protein [Patescibacteria group bacterium]|nr:O-antigen ligase family protein [Patescibacteria group bacterium]
MLYSFNREKIINFCQTAIDWIFLFLVFWIPLVFAFFHGTYNVFALDKVIIIRIFVSLAGLFFLAKIFLAGQLEYRYNRYFLVIFALLACSWLVSAIFAPIPAFSFWGNYERQNGFFTLIFYLLFFLLLIFNLQSLSIAKRFVYAMIFSSLLACGYGLIQFFGLDLIKWAETGRIFSTLGQPNFFAHWLILIIPFSVYALVFGARRVLTRSLIAILLAGQIFCLLLTYSRSAWLGLAAEIFLALLFFLFLKGRKKIAFGLLIFSIAAGIFASSFFSFSPRPAQLDYSLKSRLESVFDFSQGSIRARLNIWQYAASEIKEESSFRLFFGYGPDSLSDVFARHYQTSWPLDEKINTWPDRAHNVFLDIVLSFGLVGLAIYLVLFIYLAVLARRFFKTAMRDENYWLAAACVLALAGYFVNNLFNFSDIPEYLYFYLILGLLIFSLSRAAPRKEIKISLTVFSRAAIFISFFIFIAIFIFYFNLRPLLADRYFMRAVISINGDCPDALNDISKAIAWSGGNSLFYQGEYLAGGLLCFDKLPKNEQDQLKGNMLLYLESIPAENLFSFAKSKADVEALLAQGSDKAYVAAAEKDFTALAEKYPQISLVYEDWADFELKMGRNDAAIDIANQGLETLPLAAMASRGYFSHRPEIETQLISYYNLLGTAYAQKNEADSALSYYEKIVAVNSSYPQAYKKIADIYYQRKDLDKAIWYNKKGYQLAPQDYSWPLAIGLLYKEKGDSASAIDYFNQVLELNPGNQEAQSLLDGLKNKIK